MKTKPARVVQLVGATLMVVMVIFYVLTEQSHLLWIVPTAGLVTAALLILIGFAWQRHDDRLGRQ